MKRFFAVLFILLAVFLLYVSFTHRNTDMSFRQKLLKTVYPAVTALARLTSSNSDVIANKKMARPSRPVYEIPITMIDGSVRTLAEYKGKKILIVNTASDCGYTGQYDGLQRLYEQHGDKLVVIGFPANDFKEQEKGSAEEIAAFCKKNYGVSFPLAEKSVVVRSAQQHPLYRWLTDPSANGWNSKLPSWNFSKYLLNEQGVLTHYFGPAVEPDSPDITKALQ